MNIAVILAGGSGNRFGGELPKQFLTIEGKTILEHTIDAFEKNQRINEIAIVSKEDFIPDVERMVQDNHYLKVKKILAGGKERYHSSLAAIEAYPDDSLNLIFHDAVRPLLTDRIINDCIDALQRYNAVDVAIPATDTIIQVDPLDRTIESIPDRSRLMNGQTPQCFKRGVIKKAYEIALKDPNFKTTDDCGVVRRYLGSEKVYVVLGETSNMKLTHTDDLTVMKFFFKQRANNTNR